MTSSPSPRRLVVAGFDAEPGERLDWLRDLVAAVSRLGWEPDVLLAAGGPGLNDMRREVPVTVSDEFRRRGIAFLPTTLGVAAPGRALKRSGLRRFHRRWAGEPWIVADPSATGLLRYGDGRPGPVLACLPTPSDQFAGLAPIDRSVLAGAAGWIVRTDEQGVELDAADLGPRVVIGSLSMPDPAVVTVATWPLLLVPTPRAWTEINHTIEVAAALADRHPSVPIQWLVQSSEDEWLARFDLDQLGLADQISTVWASGAPVGQYRMLVRTGYGPDEADRCAEARHLGIPVVAFESGDVGDGRPAVAPFDVDGLVAEVDRVLPDEASVRLVEERYQASVAAHAEALGALGQMLDRVARTTRVI